MALIDKTYVFVQEESVQRGVSLSTHPVEKGIDITDHVKREPVVISISGEIVGSNASEKLKKLTKKHQTGKYVNYVGRNIMKNCIITSFNTGHPNTVFGGCTFDMELTEIRIAKSPTSTSKKAKKTKGGTQQVVKKSKATTKKYTVKNGDTLWGIAKSFYGNGASYTKLYDYNKSTIGSDPSKIKAGQTLTIPS